MNDDTINARADQMLAMMTAEDKDMVTRKLARPGKQTPSMLTIATALARFETKTGERTAKIKLSKAMIKLGNEPQGI